MIEANNRFDAVLNNLSEAEAEESADPMEVAMRDLDDIGSYNLQVPSTSSDPSSVNLEGESSRAQERTIDVGTEANKLTIFVGRIKQPA